MVTARVRLEQLIQTGRTFAILTGRLFVIQDFLRRSSERMGWGAVMGQVRLGRVVRKGGPLWLDFASLMVRPAYQTGVFDAVKRKDGHRIPLLLCVQDCSMQ